MLLAVILLTVGGVCLLLELLDYLFDWFDNYCKFLFILIGALCFNVGVILIAVGLYNIANEDKYYVDMCIERESLVNLLDDAENKDHYYVLGLFEKVDEFNNKVESSEKHYSSVFIGSLYNEKVAKNMKIIDVSEYVNVRG